jgi:hypothetical protein
MISEEEKQKRRIENEKKGGRIFGLALIPVPDMENGALQFILGFFIIPALLITGFIYVIDN